MYNEIQTLVSHNEAGEETEQVKSGKPAAQHMLGQRMGSNFGNLKERLFNYTEEP